MKKLIVAAAALAVAVIGAVSLGVPGASADVSSVNVVNTNVVTALNGSAVDWTAPTAAELGNLSTWETASADQLNSDMTNAGSSYIIVHTDGTTSNVTVNGRGLVCDEVFPAAATGTGCDGTTGMAPGAVTSTTGNWLVLKVTGLGSFASGSKVAAIQGPSNVEVDSAALTTASQAHDAALAVTKPTIQEAAPSCAITDSTSAPTRGGAGLTFTDINGTALVGYAATWASSSTSTMTVAAPTTVSMQLTGTTTITAPNVYCGVAAGSANLNATAPGSEISGITTGVTRTQAITVTGVPAAIALTASPAAIACNGTNTSTITATVTDSAGNNVVDNTPVTFSVVALGTANPVTTKTTGGTASSVITPLSGTTAGTVVTVTAGTVSQQITIACQQALLTPTAPAAAATATPKGGVVGPNTGTGGYLGSSSSTGFPMWALAALALASVVLVGGGVVVRRAGK